MPTEATFTPEQQAERLETALQCSYEVESLARHLNGNLPTEPDYMFLRALVLRICDLNNVVMSVLDGDQGRTMSEMQIIISGGRHAE